MRKLDPYDILSFIVGWFVGTVISLAVLIPVAIIIKLIG